MNFNFLSQNSKQSGHLHESWTLKKAECWRINAFDLWCWKRLLRVPWTARGSSRSTLREISPEYSLEGLMLKLNLQYFDHLMKSRLTGKHPDAGKDWRQKKGVSEDEMVRLNGHEFEQFQEIVKLRGAWHAAIHGVAKSRTRLSTEQL